MSDFLVLAGRCAADPAVSTRAEAVLRALDRPVTARAACNGSNVRTVARTNGTNAGIAIDYSPGDWLAVAGTWFLGDDLASGDEAALLARIRSEGASRVANELEGFFVIVHGNGTEASVTVITDIAGACHCYAREIDGGIAISTSAACLAALARSSLDPVAATEFLATGIIFEDRSLWAEVRKLPPATVRTVSAGRWTSPPPYWSVGDTTPERLGLASAADSIGAALTGAARRIGRRFPRVLCDVTGGYDSRAAIAGFLAAGIPISATVSGPAASADVRISKEIAARFRLPHRHMAPGAPPDATAVATAFRLTDGQYDLVEYARIAGIHASHARDCDISVNGSYGELARAYWWELLFPSIGKTEVIDANRIAAARLGAAAWDAGVITASSRVELVPHLAEVVGRANHGLENLPNTTQMDNVYLRLRMQRWQGRIASSTDHLWPCLSPFMLKSVLVPVLETRWKARMRSLVVREMLARTAPELAALPMEHGYPALPARATNVHRFWPLVPYYAGRVASKLARIAGVPGATSAAAESPAAVLARDEALRERLEFRAFRNSGIADESGLAAFCTRAGTPGFAFSGEWCRLFSIEVALGESERARAVAGG